MKLIKVKCPKNKKIEVEELSTKAARCPANCPLKQKNKCFNNTFRYTSVLSDAVIPDVPYVENGVPATPTVSTKPAIASFAPVAAAPVTKEEPRAEQSSMAASPFGYREDIFSKEAETASPNVIERGNVFGTPEPMESTASGVAPSTASMGRSRTLDKYNEVLIEDDSIFAGVRRKKPDEPCFEDGALVFYEGVRVGYSSGNAQAALRHIFSHWYVSRVFCEDEKTLRDDFLGLLMLRGFRDKEEQIRAIIEDPTLDVDHKFFRLFYRVIYRNQINGFYWHKGDSLHRKVVPYFQNQQDFYKCLASSSDPNAFLAKFDTCMDELITFLRAGSDEGDGREWFMNTIPRFVAEQQRLACYVRQRSNGSMEIINFGSISDFVKRMSKPDTLENLEDRVAFLERFEISKNYRIHLRTVPLSISKRQGMEDDSVYTSVGLTDFETAQCATAYNKYITLLKEYIRVFEPEQLTIGVYHFSARNFYTEVMDLIAIAGAHLSEQNSSDTVDSHGFYLLKSLFARGVFDYYESLCETEKLQELKQNFLEHDKINLEMYFRLDNIVHTIYIDGVHTTISDYLSDVIGENPSGDVRRLVSHLRGEDPILQAYFRARISSKDERDAIASIDRLITESAQNASI